MAMLYNNSKAKSRAATQSSPSRRWWLLWLLPLWLVAGCSEAPVERMGKLTLGTVSYDEGQQTLDRYARFKDYLAQQTQSVVEVEPAYNEQRALERIRSRSWSLVFASPGLTALAIQQAQYEPLFPLQGVNNRRSILVVRKDSPVRAIADLADRPVALGQVGSITGYYFPLYNLYGLTLSELMFAPTPRMVLEWVASGKAAAGALSKEEFDQQAAQIAGAAFRILAADSHVVPTGALLVSPAIERNRQEQLRKILRETPGILAQEAGFIPNAPLPDYGYLFSVVERVRSIFPDTPNAAQLKPARLFKQQSR
ncbi:phosphate/phosphite/phosphonate ABC transporter substrate-binding protein [Gloeobacter violaceus]|uniref:Glr0659 protein n=1 Tax=Gloeobacter violaceus (strain ATCC 29082 / PCC 7421) TaxID=251221 RepID=Q7NMV6_GLOVI|nr:PhnD/SsuA/transferrin family substrate-binding protein [Gloeobacter violaceus]BAC88600.1 glr0659 [Gloeobacter violaceus PCC 7421]